MNEREEMKGNQDIKLVKNVVFLFKAPKENEEDKFVNSLESAGFDSVNIPVLSFVFVNHDILPNYLARIENYSALVLTSTKTVDAIGLALQTLSKDLRGVTCYVVGKSTGEAARLIGLNPRGEDTGNAVELSKLIIKELQPFYAEVERLKEKRKPVLYPCSSIRRDTIRGCLEENNIPLQELSVYDTCRNERLEESLQESINQKGYPEFVVFFSPSGVKFTSPLVKSGLLPIQNMKVIAIGPSTASELIEHGMTIYGVADKPDPKSLIDILRTSKNS